jgi:hypothetical protein
MNILNKLTMKKLLILGANPETIPLIETAKSMGIYTIVTDPDPFAPAKKFADKGININGMDIDSLVEFGKQENIDGVLVGVADRLIQPYQKHTRSPNGFIYIYSFSVNTEQHQPSGCSNFSKIDTKELFFNIIPNLGTQQFRIYGLNYNILRIYSGMGGIAFSS